MRGWRAVLAGLAAWLALEAAAIVVVFALVEGSAVRGCGGPPALELEAPEGARGRPK